MISVDEAWAALAETAPLGKTQSIRMQDASGRVLAAPLVAQRTQPPCDVSAMDGYAIRFADIENGITEFSVIGEAPAGGRFDGLLKEADAVRIFTGGLLPTGADHIVIQEDVSRAANKMRLIAAQNAPRHIRKAGQDFAQGDVLLSAGRLLKPADLALAANGNHAELSVVMRPRIAFVASGDEIVPAGTATQDTHIPDSISAALAAMVAQWGGETVAGIITADDKNAFGTAVTALPPADVIVPIGGASVGDYDFAKQVFYNLGYEPVFEKIAVKPGKPCWFAKGDANLVLGLPGNPSSAMVTATLFLRPVIAHLLGRAVANDWQYGTLAHELEANGGRESYLRGSRYMADEGRFEVHISPRQDSALTTTFAEANCLVQRKPNAPALKAGASVKILPL